MNIYKYNTFIELLYWKNSKLNNKNKIIIKKIYGYLTRISKKFIYIKIKNNKTIVYFKINKKSRNLWKINKINI